MFSRLAARRNLIRELSLFDRGKAVYSSILLSFLPLLWVASRRQLKKEGRGERQRERDGAKALSRTNREKREKEEERDWVEGEVGILLFIVADLPPSDLWWCELKKKRMWF